MKRKLRKTEYPDDRRGAERRFPALLLLLLVIVLAAGGCGADRSAEMLPAVGPDLPGLHRGTAEVSTDPVLPLVGPRLGSTAAVSNTAPEEVTPGETMVPGESAVAAGTSAARAEETSSVPKETAQMPPEETLPAVPTETEPVTEPAVTKNPAEEQTQPPAPPETEAPTVPLTEPSVEAPTEPPTQAPTEPPAEPPPTVPPTELPVGNGSDIWIGDSRFVSLSLFFPSGHKQDTIIAANGKSFAWFSETAVPLLRQYLSGVPAKHVFIGMGVNDCAVTYRYGSKTRAADYAALINELIAQYPAVTFYFCSVGPADGETYGSVSIPSLNRESERFNEEMRTLCQAVYIDCGEYLKREGFQTTDGIHYNTETYRRWLNYVLSFVE